MVSAFRPGFLVGGFALNSIFMRNQPLNDLDPTGAGKPSKKD